MRLFITENTGYGTLEALNQGSQTVSLKTRKRLISATLKNFKS